MSIQMKRTFRVLKLKATLFSFFVMGFLRAGEEERPYTINFHDVPVIEFIQFVTRISNVNFIFNHQDLQFNITLASGHPVSSEQVVKMLMQILRSEGLLISEEEGYLAIHKGSTETSSSSQFSAETTPIDASLNSNFTLTGDHKPRFLVYKLKYHEGHEIEETIRKICSDLATKPETSPHYLSALRSVQWVKTTNSLVYSGEEESVESLKQLIEDLDTPLSQVFIEVLVIETDARNTSEFGLQWGAGGKHKENLGGGIGNFNPGRAPSPFALAFQGVDGSHPPTGPKQIPVGNGFDMGVIGDLIFHRGSSFLSLSALVSALQTDGNSTIILNQKIITQDNKPSTLFVGDNIPFTGSVVSTIGTGQQTTANVEYRDIGVNLSITPRLGDGDVVTLDINEEITEVIPSGMGSISSSQVAGIQTTKTNMMTHVHVPDRHFLILSGMIRNAKNYHKSGLPCLGGLPFLGAAFSKTDKQEERRNVIIFVRPHIIRSCEEYKKLTNKQEECYRDNSPKDSIDEAMRLVQEDRKEQDSR